MFTNVAPVGFQFHYGSIKRPLQVQLQHQISYFNSIMVRLKDFKPLHG